MWTYFTNETIYHQLPSWMDVALCQISDYWIILHSEAKQASQWSANLFGEEVRSLWQKHNDKFYHVLHQMATPQWRLMLSAVLLCLLILIIACRKIKVKRSSCKETHQTVETLSKEEFKNKTSMYTTAVNLAKTCYEDGHSEALLELICRHSLDVNQIHPTDGLSIFLSACLSGEVSVVKQLLRYGADIRISSRDGDSPLYLATYATLTSADNDTALLEALIKAGCNVNAQNNRGYTPLHRAASHGNIQVIKCLKRYGADPYLTNRSGIYPLDSAINAGHVESARYLKIQLDNPSYVWDIVEPHTPPFVRLGLQSPMKKHLMESSMPTHKIMSRNFLMKSED